MIFKLYIKSIYPTDILNWYIQPIFNRYIPDIPDTYPMHTRYIRYVPDMYPIWTGPGSTSLDRRDVTVILTDFWRLFCNDLTLILHFSENIRLFIDLDSSQAGYLTVIWRLFDGYFTVISRLFHGYFTVISRLFNYLTPSRLRLGRLGVSSHRFGGLTLTLTLTLASPHAFEV